LAAIEPLAQTRHIPSERVFVGKLVLHSGRDCDVLPKSLEQLMARPQDAIEKKWILALVE
jgi:hypothetical protein